MFADTTLVNCVQQADVVQTQTRIGLNTVTVVGIVVLAQGAAQVEAECT